MNGWNKSYKFYYVIGFVAILISGIVLNIYKIKREQEYVESEYKQLHIKFEAALNLFARLSEEIYDRYEDDFAQTVYTASHFSDLQNTLRTELYDRHVEEYNGLELQGISQLHIHTADGKSFLRYHLSHKFGDSLFLIRPSIRKVILEKRYVYGYEVGRKYGGFRYIYPLFFKGGYVGSMEFGVDFNAIDKEMRKQFGGQYTFLVEKSEIDRIVWEKYKNLYYSLTPFSRDYLFMDNRNTWFKSMDFNFSSDDSVQKDLKTKLPFYRYVMTSKGKILIIFIPIENINGDKAAYLISVADDDPLTHITVDFWIQLGLVSIIIVLLATGFYRRNVQNQEINAILNQQHELVFLTDGFKVSHANKSFLDFFGYVSVKEFRSEHDCACDFFLEKEGYLHRLNNNLSWLEAILANPMEQYRVLMKNTMGDERAFVISVNVYGYDARYVCTMTDITHLNNESQLLAEKAYLDALTGLLNRRKADELFTKEMESARSFLYPLSMTILDIDTFKQINDTYGHDRGDLVLIYLAELLKNSVRETDTVFRWGGEEFIILFRDMLLEDAQSFCETLRESIEHYVFESGKHLSCSFGVTELRDEDTQKTFIARADEALYKAKSLGRNRTESL